MKKQTTKKKQTKKAKKPDVARLIFEVMEEQKCCPSEAMFSLAAFFIDELAKQDKNQMLRLLKKMSDQIKKTGSIS